MVHRAAPTSGNEPHHQRPKLGISRVNQSQLPLLEIRTLTTTLIVVSLLMHNASVVVNPSVEREPC